MKTLEPKKFVLDHKIGLVQDTLHQSDLDLKTEMEVNGLLKKADVQLHKDKVEKGVETAKRARDLLFEP